MDASPFITILTASLNSGATIKKTLESVSNQTFQDMEHIVIDGGSIDETLDILNRYKHSYNLTWISEPDHGISDALNKGLRLSLGRYIVVIQADDELLDIGILRKVFHCLRKEQIDIMGFSVVLDDPVRGNVLRKPIRLLWWNRFKFIFPHQGCFVHRRVFDRIGGFREGLKISLDYDFFYRALNHKSTVRFGGFPIALMGGYGIGSVPEFTSERLREERFVQELNERNPVWKVAQLAFRMVYMPYKTRLLPKLKKRPMLS